MPFRPAFRLVGGLAAVAVLSGCTSLGRYESDFPVVIENRTINTIQVLANGNEIGQVAAGQTGSFSLRLPESSPNVFTNGVAPTPQAQVVFSAKDLKTGTISTTKSVTLSQTPPAYVTFNTVDFPTVARTVANFNSSPNTPGINQDVFFNAASSTGSNNTYTWAFGDGSTGAGVQTTHQYSQVGTFTVTLTATSDNGQSSTQSRTINVSASLAPQSAIFTFSPRTPATNQDVIFTAVTVMPGQTQTYSWDFGDGLNGTGPTVTHRFTRQSVYTVQLRVSNNLGQAATSSQQVPVTATLAGTVNFTFSPTTPGVNDDVFFNASSSTVTSVTFSWDFGDGSRGTGVTTSHQFSRVGIYTVTLTATNDVGQSATNQTPRTVPVSASSTGLVADFTFSPTDPTISRGTNAVIFNAAPSSAGATTWTWDYGDGSAADSGQRATHTFSRAGTWVVRLTVTDSSGRTATVAKNVTVAACIVNAQGVCIG